MIAHDHSTYVLSDEALDFCADCAVSLLGEEVGRLREALERIANGPASADTAIMRSTALDALEGVDQG